MRRYNNPVKQQGVVLAFVLVMLLLLTTISVNMIQQNQQNLATANNARQQVAVLSTAETSVLGSGVDIDVLRYLNKVDHKCKTTEQIDEGRTFGISKVIGVYCMLLGAGSPETQCPYKLGVRDKTNVACKRLNDAGGYNPCPVEVYALETLSIDLKSGAKRTIQSKYAIDCTGDTR